MPNSQFPDPILPQTANAAADKGSEVQWEELRNEVRENQLKVEKAFTVDDEKIERVLQSRADALAQRRASDLAAAPTVQVLLLRAGANLYGLRPDPVWEVIRFQNYAPVPGASPHLLGVVSVHNELHSLMDLLKITRQTAPEGTELNHAVVLRHDELRLALACTEVIGLQSIPTTQMQESGVFQAGQEFGVMLDLTTVFSAIQANSPEISQPL